MAENEKLNMIQKCLVGVSKTVYHLSCASTFGPCPVLHLGGLPTQSYGRENCLSSSKLSDLLSSAVSLSTNL